MSSGRWPVVVLLGRGGGQLVTNPEDASYRSSPCREPFHGLDEIRAYWRGGAGTQRETRVRMGRPFVDGNRVAVEWWTTMIDDDLEVTLPDCLLLSFDDDGRCANLREY